MNDLSEIGFLTLQRIKPDLARDAYDEMNISFAELVGVVRH